MAYIKHFFRKESVYEECCDRGTRFYDWVLSDVEHFCCSACGAEVGRRNSFCPHCGEKLSGGIKEQYKNCSCAICGKHFRQLGHENEICCLNCRSILHKRNDVEIGKAFYELGRQAGKQEHREPRTGKQKTEKRKN